MISKTSLIFSVRAVLLIAPILSFSTNLAFAETAKKGVASKVGYDTKNTIYHEKDGDGEIRFGARVKVDFNEDLNGKQPGTTYGLDPAAIPLTGRDSDAYRRHNFNTSMASSRISFEATKKYSCASARGYIELDFNGGLSSGVRTSNSYLPRIRHAYADISSLDTVNQLLIGQTWTNFATSEVNAFSTNNAWPTFRTAQIRYTRLLVPNLTLAFAIERPNTQYYANNLNGNTGAYLDNDTSGSFGKSGWPDLTMKLQHYQGVNLFAIRGVVRRLDMKISSPIDGIPATTNTFNKSKTAWGLGASAMFRVANPLSFLFQVQGGNGTGRYIDDLCNQKAYDSFLQYSTLAGAAPFIYETVKAINFIAGATITWNEKWETNIGGSYTKLQKPKSIVFQPVAGTAELPNQQIQRYHGNLVYMPIPKTFFIFEVEQYYRRTGFDAGYRFKGRDTRFVFSFIRNF